MANFNKLIRNTTKLVSSFSNLSKSENNTNYKDENSKATVKKGIKFKILNDTFDLSEIKDYYIENIEYIYLPVLKEEEINTKVTKKKKIVIKQSNDYYPYAAIIKENNKLNMSNVKSYSFAESFAKEAIQKATNAIIEKIDDLEYDSDSILLKLKTTKCIDSNGRRFKFDPEDVPYKLIKMDGTIKQYNATVDSYNETINVKSVPCLVIEADKNYYYFGNGINFENLNEIFDELTEQINSNVISTCDSNNEINDVETRMKKLKDLYDQGLIPEDEYKKKVNELLSNI